MYNLPCWILSVKIHYISDEWNVLYGKVDDSNDRAAPFASPVFVLGPAVLQLPASTFSSSCSLLPFWRHQWSHRWWGVPLFSALNATLQHGCWCVAPRSWSCSHMDAWVDFKNLSWSQENWSRESWSRESWFWGSWSREMTPWFLYSKRRLLTQHMREFLQVTPGPFPDFLGGTWVYCYWGWGPSTKNFWESW